jgi:hypothetical protein
LKVPDSLAGRPDEGIGFGQVILAASADEQVFFQRGHFSFPKSPHGVRFQNLLGGVRP